MNIWFAGLLLLGVSFTSSLPTSTASAPPFNIFRLPCRSGPKQPPTILKQKVCDVKQQSGVVCGVMLTSFFEILGGNSVDVQFLDQDQVNDFVNGNQKQTKEVCSLLLASDTVAKKCCTQLNILCSNIDIEEESVEEEKGKTVVSDKGRPSDIFDIFGFEGEGEENTPESPREADLFDFMQNVFDIRRIRNLFNELTEFE